MVINGQICSNNSPDPGADGRVAEQVGAAGVGDGPPDVLLVGHPGWPRHQPPLAAHLGEAGGRGEEEGNQHECGPAAVHDDDDNSDCDTLGIKLLSGPGLNWPASIWTLDTGPLQSAVTPLLLVTLSHI